MGLSLSRAPQYSIDCQIYRARTGTIQKPVAVSRAGSMTYRRLPHAVKRQPGRGKVPESYNWVRHKN